MTKDPKVPGWVSGVKVLLSDPRVLGLIAAAMGLGGFTGRASADAGGVTPAQVDSTVSAHVAPVIRKQNRMDTAVMQIKFSLDVMMSDVQKQRADSLYRAALKNINYGGSP